MKNLVRTFYKKSRILSFASLQKMVVVGAVLICSISLDTFSEESSSKNIKETAQTALPVNQKPKALEGVGITEKLGAKIPLNEIKFKNEKGEEVVLSQFFTKGHPVVLTMAYSKCPGLCGVVLNALLDSMKGLDWTPGEQYTVVNVSLDPEETVELSNEKKESYVKAFTRPGQEQKINEGWHFLTGSEANIKRLASEIGFGYKWVEEEAQFAHGAAAFVLTPEGIISRILYGISYRSADLKLSLLEASNGKIGTIVDRIILFCYQYNPQLRKYSLGIMRIVQVGALFTTLFLMIFLGIFWFKEKRKVKEDIREEGVQ